MPSQVTLAGLIEDYQQDDQNKRTHMRTHISYEGTLEKMYATHFSIRHSRYFLENCLHFSDLWPADFRQLM